GEFQRTITLSVGAKVTQGDGVLDVRDGDTILVSYTDNDGGNVVVHTASARVDCSAPSFSHDVVVDSEPNALTFNIDSDEPAIVTLELGLSCDALTQTIMAHLPTDYDIRVDDLIP